MLKEGVYDEDRQSMVQVEGGRSRQVIGAHSLDSASGDTISFQESSVSPVRQMVPAKMNTEMNMKNHRTQ